MMRSDADLYKFNVTDFLKLASCLMTMNFLSFSYVGEGVQDIRHV